MDQPHFAFTSRSSSLRRNWRSNYSLDFLGVLAGALSDLVGLLSALLSDFPSDLDDPPELSAAFAFLYDSLR